MSYLLDTNVVSELRRVNPHGGVRAWFQGVEAEELFISAVTCGEIQVGIERTRTTDPAKAVEIESWLNRLVSDWNVVPLGADCFRKWAKLMHGHSDNLTLDAMIAATAIVHGLIVVTRNTDDFSALGVETVDPWGYR